MIRSASNDERRRRAERQHQSKEAGLRQQEQNRSGSDSAFATPGEQRQEREEEQLAQHVVPADQAVFERGIYDLAMADFKRAIELKPEEASFYIP